MELLEVRQSEELGRQVHELVLLEPQRAQVHQWREDGGVKRLHVRPLHDEMRQLALVRRQVFLRQLRPRARRDLKGRYLSLLLQ